MNCTLFLKIIYCYRGGFSTLHATFTEVLTCLTCTAYPTSRAHASLNETTSLARAQEAAVKLKECLPHRVKTKGISETIDCCRGNSPPKPVTLKEGSFGSALHHVKSIVDELRVMHRIGQALNTPNASQGSMSTPVRMKYNPLSVYASKSKLATGKFSYIMFR